MTSIRTKLG